LAGARRHRIHHGGGRTRGRGRPARERERGTAGWAVVMSRGRVGGAAPTTSATWLARVGPIVGGLPAAAGVTARRFGLSRA